MSSAPFAHHTQGEHTGSQAGPPTLPTNLDELLRHVLEDFDKTPTPAIIAFEVAVIAVTLLFARIASRRVPRFGMHYLTMAAGVLLFETFTSPMWRNYHLGVWAYLYQDVSWIFTLQWSTLLLGGWMVVTLFLGHWPAWKRFILLQVLLTTITLVIETIVVALGIRAYAPEVQAILDADLRPFGVVSIHQLYYLPVLFTLTLGFYLYWVPEIEGRPRRATRPNWLLRLLLSLVAVFFFEILVEPLVANVGFPSWSYVYRDISLVLIGVWVVLIASGTVMVDVLFRQADRLQRFLLIIAFVSAVYTPIEAWLVLAGHRVYGGSARASFSGVTTTFGGIPIEVVLGIPLYVALVVATIRFWAREVESPRDETTRAAAVGAAQGGGAAAPGVAA